MKGGDRSSREYTRPISNSDSYSSNYSEDKCASLNFKTLLQNIQPAIINYSVDDTLDVQLDSVENVIATGIHGICGNITAIKIIELIDCLKEGKLFKAVIISVSPSSCEVTIRPLRK